MWLQGWELKAHLPSLPLSQRQGGWIKNQWSVIESIICIQGVQFSCSVTSDSLQPHGLQHARPLCPSPTPGVYSNSCPSSQWCHPTISSSVIPFSSCPQSFPASGSFQVSHIQGSLHFKKMMVVGNLPGWWARGGAGKVACRGEHGSSVPLPTHLALVSLSCDCSRVVSFYNQPVI